MIGDSVAVTTSFADACHKQCMPRFKEPWRLRCSSRIYRKRGLRSFYFTLLAESNKLFYRSHLTFSVVNLK